MIRNLPKRSCVSLEHNGYRVFIPPAQTVTGMAMFSNGDLAAARVIAEQNIRELIEPAREGYAVVCTEPTAALCLTQEYPMLVQNDDAGVVAQQTTDAGSFLADLFRRGKLKLDFKPLPMRIGWHTPCHVKALQNGTPMLDLLALIPELTVVTIEKGCTGMAGTFGIAAENFQKSIEIGAENSFGKCRPLTLSPASPIAVPAGCRWNRPQPYRRYTRSSCSHCPTG